MFKKGDTDNDGLINFAEFVEYIVDHEKKLKLAFKTLDSNKDGENKDGYFVSAYSKVMYCPLFI